MSNPAIELLRRVIDEEIERHGQWWDVEWCWVVARGEGVGGPLDEITPVYEAVERRTGVSAERLETIFKPFSLHPMGQRGWTLTTGRAHRERRIADGTLTRTDHGLEAA